MGERSVKYLCPHREEKRLFVGLYTIILEMDLGPKGHHSFVEGGGPMFGPLPHTCTHLPKPNQVGLGTGASASASKINY